MKRIELKSLYLENFKGCRERQIDFGQITNIYGANATGKTTLFDAFTWLLFGTNSAGATKFDVRPLDEAGKTVDNVEIIVRAVLLVGGEGITLQKTQKQNWVKKRGSDTAKLQGNVNTYEINTFPASEAEFKNKVATMLSDEVTPAGAEKLFRMLTDPKYFASLPWKEQREVVMRFISEITDVDVVATDPEKYAPIISELRVAPVEKCLEKATRAMSKLKDRQKELPIRIDQASKSLVEVPELADLELQRNALKEQLAEVQKQRDDAGESFKAVDAVRDEIIRVWADINAIEAAAQERTRKALRDAETTYDEASRRANRMFAEKKEKEAELKRLQDDLPGKQAELTELQEKYREAARITADTDLGELKHQDKKFIDRITLHQKNIAILAEETFPEESTVCPVCHREFPADQIAEMRENFERNKAENIRAHEDKIKELIADNRNAIIAAGNAASQAVKDLQAKIAAASAELEKLKQDWTAATREDSRAYEYKNSLPTQPDLSEDQEYAALQDKLSALQMQLGGMDTGEGLKQQIAIRERGIQEELDAVNRQFAAVELNEKTQESIEQLRAELRAVSQQVADQERKVYLLEELSRAKMEMMSAGINNLFDVVNIKLFDMQINGGMKPTCEITVDGVPYSSLNSAGKMQAGLDVIRALQGLYSVAAPIWLDNRESVTEIPAMDAQIINLYVSPADTELSVEVE